MTSYPRYPAYKPSGVDWLGDLPAHWEMRRLKFMANINSEILPETTPSDYRIRYIDIGNVSSEGVITEAQEFEFENAPSRARRRVRAGDTLISTVRTYLQAIAYLETPATNQIASTGFAVLRPREFLYPKFLYYLVRSQGFVDTVMAHSVGVGYPAINPSALAGLWGWLPHILEQRAIVAYLDRETARLDALIDKKRQLIGLLTQQRAALISRAVTKGLNPHAKMKPSGVEWLGEVPKEWETRRIKWLTRKIGSGKTPKGGGEKYVSSGVKFLRSQNVHFTGLRLDDVVFIDEATDSEMSSSRVLGDDVLLNITGASLGRCALVPKDFPPANVNQHVCIVRIMPDKLLPQLLNYILMSDGMQAQIFASEDGISREGLTFQAIGNMSLALPSFDQQHAIVAYLDRETARIDALITKIEDSIGLLQRQRVALISAAVTGKVDVRGL